MSPDRIVLTVDGEKRSLAWLIKHAEAATDVWVDNCPGLSALPDLPAATHVRVYNCPGLSGIFSVGKDARGYEFSGVHVRGAWRVQAGCRLLSINDARAHWGAGGSSDRPDCLALVEIIAAAAEKLDAAKSGSVAA